MYGLPPNMDATLGIYEDFVQIRIHLDLPVDGSLHSRERGDELHRHCAVAHRPPSSICP
jgi:hypothetical protein